MKNAPLDVLVIGAGHAGLCASYYLRQKGIKHLVLERGTIGESWRSQRWDSFVLNTADAGNQLPGNELLCVGTRFLTATAFANLLQDYVTRFQLPVKEQTAVIAVERGRDEHGFSVTVSENGRTVVYTSMQVLIASGAQNTGKRPVFAQQIPPNVLQLHAGEYRNAKQLPQGAVLVVGSAQSGCQVAADLAAAGKKVWLSTSMVGRLPRRYRGKDIMDWLFTIGFFDAKKSDITDPHIVNIKPPQLTGVNDGQQTISLQWLAKQGVRIVGKTKKADASGVFFQRDADTHVQFADGFSAMVKNKIDGFITANHIHTPAPATDSADIPDADADCVTQIDSLRFMEDEIGTVIWATGFKPDFSFLNLSVFDPAGDPVHRQGVSSVPGLYFLGLPWLRTMKSALINGTKDDAAFIVEKMYAYAQQFYLNQVPS